MTDIKNEIVTAAKKVKAEITELSLTEGETIRQQINQNFTSCEKPHWAWECLLDAFNIHNQQAWKWISEFVGNQECILFFNDFDEIAVFQIANGNQLTEILEECYLFEFYVTNRELEYLFCENHHDIFYAAGKAKDWLEKKVAEMKNNKT